MKAKSAINDSGPSTNAVMLSIQTVNGSLLQKGCHSVVFYLGKH